MYSHNSKKITEKAADLTLENTYEGTFEDIKIFGNSVQDEAILPSGYQQVEYIESTGTQYIDTGIKPNSNTHIISIFSIKNVSANRNYVLGCYSDNFENRIQFSYSSTAFLGWGNNYNNTLSLNVDLNKHLINIEKGKFILDNVKIAELSSTFNTNAKNITLFSNNQNGTVLNNSSIKMYNLKMYDNTILVRNLIPCYRKSDNVIGLYDTVESKFYTNQGTGTFLKGNDITLPTPDFPIEIKSCGDEYSLPEQYQRVEYIESTGTQYINTDKKITSKSKIEMSFLTLKNKNDAWQSLFGVQTSSSENRFYLLLGSPNNLQCQIPHSKSDVLYMQKIGTFATEPQSNDLIIEKNTMLNITFDISKRSLRINDYISTSTSTYDIINSSYNLYLLNRNNQDSGEKTNCAIGRLYNFKIYNNDILIQHLVPCYRKSDNVIGLYDTVENKFYTNSGTGTFLKGNDINYSGTITEVISNKNLFRMNNFYEDAAKLKVNQGNLTITENSITLSNPTGATQCINNIYPTSDNPTTEEIEIIKRYGAFASPNSTVVLGYLNPRKTKHKITVFVYDENFKYVGGLSSQIVTYTKHDFYVTIRQTPARYFLYRFDNEGYGTDSTTLEIKDIQVEHGDSTWTSSYVQNKYQEITIPVQQPMRKIGDYEDTFVNLDGKWYERHFIEEILLNGSENIGITDSGKITMQFIIPLAKNTISDKQSALKIFSDCYLFCKWSDNPWNINNSISYYKPNQLRIKDDRFSNVNDFKTWLQQNPVTVNYVLATPIDIPCTDEQTEQLEQLRTSITTYDEKTKIYSTDIIHPTLEINTYERLSNEFKQRVLEGKPVRSYLKVLSTDTLPEIIINEENYLKDFIFDETRYVEGQGFIGQGVAKEVNGNFVNVSEDFTIQDREFELYMGVDLNDEGTETEYIKYGTFIVQAPEEANQVNDNTSFESLDYMIKTNVEYIDRITYPCTLRALFYDVVAQAGLKSKVWKFHNSDFIVENNQFNSGTTIREVLKRIAEMAFSWVRIDEDDYVCLDFKVKDEIDEELNEDTYYDFTKSDDYGPLNNIIFNMENVEGQAVTNPEPMPENAISLTISDNPFAYTEDTSRELIQQGSEIFGLSYVPLELKSIGYIYLNCLDKIRVKNLNNVSHETYLFNHKISYNGTVLDEMSSKAQTNSDAQYDFVDEEDRLTKQTRIQVDRNKQEISDLVKRVTDAESTEVELKTNLEGISGRIDKVQNDYQNTITTKKDASGYPIELTDAGDYSLEKWEVYGNSKQDTYEGKNKFILPESKTANGITFTNNGNGTFNISGTATANSVFYTYVDISNFVNGSNYALSISGTYSKVNAIVELYNNTTWIKVEATTAWSNPSIFSVDNTGGNKLRLGIRVVSGDTASGTNVKIQLEKGTTATNFEPYVGGTASPNPNYPQDIRSCGDDVNLLEIPDYGQTVNGVTAIAKDGTITITGTANATGYMGFPISLTLEPGIYTHSTNKSQLVEANISINYEFNAGYTTYNSTSEISSKKTYTRYVIQTVNGKTYNYTIKPKLQKGTTSTPYSPYGMGTMTEVISNKNLFDKDNDIIPLRYYNETNGTLTTTTTTGNYAQEKYIKVNPNTTYTINSDGTYVRAIEYKKDRTFIKGNSSSTNSKLIFKTNENTEYIRISFKASLDSVQLEESSTSTAYVPHQSQEITIPVQQPMRKIGDYEDTFVNLDGKWYERHFVGEKVLDGSENWINSSLGPGKFYVSNLIDFKLKTNEIGFKPISDYFIGNENTNFENNKIKFYYTNNTKFIRIENDNTSTLDQFKTWLTQNPVTVDYVLSTPEDIACTEEESQKLDELQQAQTYSEYCKLHSTDEIEPSNYKIVYLTDSVLNSQYTTKSQFEIAQNQISSVVESTNKLEGDLGSITNRVETIENDNSLEIRIQKIEDDGTEKVKTREKGFTFDDNGLTIEDSNAETKSNLNELGLSIKDNTGSEEENLLYAGYDVNTHETIVESKNMTVKKYLVIGQYSRMEDYTDIDGNPGTGIFWIGG